MKISYKKLKSLIDFEHSPEELGILLTNTGLEVEGIETVEQIKGGLAGLVIGEVITCEKHPDADKLSVTKIDIGTGELLDIVCGAPNVAKGQKVVVATVGATLYPNEGDSFVIKKSKIRGAVSEGMLCAEDEIGLGNSHAGIIVLNTELPNGTPAANYFNLDSDFCIEIGLTPNRADAASHFGVARDIKAVLNKQICLPNPKGVIFEDKPGAISVSVENTEACPRFCGLSIKNVNVKPSPDWLKSFLQTIGVNSINNLVDISNYICHVLGQPMHIFDADKIEGNQIVVKIPAKDTVIKTLDGLERKFSGSDLAICNQNKPMAIAGVFGGEESGVTEKTQNVFLEVAYFNPVSIRKTSSFHALKTDASFRYERGTDPNMPPYAIKVAAEMVLDLAGGQIDGNLIDVYPHKIENFVFEIKYKNIDRLIGKSIDRQLIKNILNSLDIEILAESNEIAKVSVPPYRVDVSREADIVEEILRIYGFDNVELSNHLQSDFISDFPKNDVDNLRIRVSESMAALGFNEIQTLSIVKPSQNEPLKNIAKGDEVRLLNPLSEDLSVMRQSLLFSGLESLVYNVNRRSKDLKFFEFGRTYYKISNENGTKYKDSSVLGLWISGNKTADNWQQKNTASSFFDLANYVNQILKVMRVSNFSIEDADNLLFDYGITYKIKSKSVVTFGAVNKKNLKVADCKQAVFYAEFDWELILKNYTSEVKFAEISKFPEVKRDLSLVLDSKIKFKDIEAVALKTERKLLKSLNVFDVYEGDKLESGKKSYSVSFILQDNEKTLNDAQIDKTMTRFIEVFEKEIGAIIRK